MYKQIRVKIFTTMVVLALVFGACKDEEKDKPDDAKVRFICKEEISLLAGKQYDAGLIIVSNDEENLYVKYTTKDKWTLKKSHLYVGDANVAFSNAAPEQFPYKAEHKNEITEYTYTIPLYRFSGECVTIAAYAEVEKYDAIGKKTQTESAWGSKEDAEQIGNDGAMKFTYCCDAGLKGSIFFTKMKLVDNLPNAIDLEDKFEFYLFKIENNGNRTPIDKSYQDLTGKFYGVPFIADGAMPTVSAFNLETGNYVFIEKEYIDWKLDPAYGDGLYFWVKDNKKGWITEIGIPGNKNAVVNFPRWELGPVYTAVTATNSGNRGAILAGLDPNGNVYYNDKDNPNTPWVVANSSHFVYAAFTRNDMLFGEVKLEFLEGDKFDVIGVGSVKLNARGDSLVISIDKLGKGSFGAITFTKDTHVWDFPKDGNIHSQKEVDLITQLGALTGFNHDNKLIIPCPTNTANNPIFLYIHCNSIQFKVYE